MTRNSIARLAGFSAGAAMVLGFAAPVAAQSVAELQAQIAALMAQLSAMSGGASASSAITSDLTVGSTGSQVVALQNSLVSGGYLMMPAGVAPGYFGALTKTAVAKWQAAVGLPATGYFGPLSRAKFTGSVAGTTTGGTTTGGTVSGTITTPGVEGTLTVTSAPVSNSTLYEGEDMVTVLGFKAEADLSDIAIQRVKIDLGTTNTLYRDILSKIYLVDDAGKTLASADLNNSTVVRNGSNEYELTMTGFSSVVAKDATRNYMIKADVQDTIDSGDLTSYTITLADNGVRGIDGAGIDLYSPALDTDVTKSVTFASSLTDSASLTVSANSSNPSSREIVAASGSSDNEADKVVLMVFDVRAEKDAIKVTDLQNFVITKSASATAGATASTSYLYVGNGTGGQLLASAALTASDADFTDIDYTIPAGTTRTFTLAVDVRSANAVQATFDASFTGNTTNVVAENSLGDTINSVSGSADANNLLVRNVGPVFSLISAPTVTYTDPAGYAGATSSAKATFKVRMQAVGSDVEFGSVSSTTYPIAGWGSAAAARSFVIYLNGSASNPSVASSTTVTLDTSKVSTVSGLDSYRLAENNEVDLTIEYVLFSKTTLGVDVTAGAYAFGLERINWLTTTTGRVASTFMSGETAWRTPSVTLP